MYYVFFFNGTATTEIYTNLNALSLHDALPIYSRGLLENANQDKYSSQLKLSKANVRANLDVQLTSSTTMQVNALGVLVETNRQAGASANDLTWMLYNTDRKRTRLKPSHIQKASMASSA